MTRLEGVIASKIDELSVLLSKTADPQEVLNIANAIDALLETLAKSRKLGGEEQG